MIGSRQGSQRSIYGSVVGSSSDDEGGIGVTRDSTSNIYVPASATEWNAFRTAFSLATANPNSVWNCQDASGNALDAIGSLPLVPNGAGFLYQQSVAGWTRLSMFIPQVSAARLQVGAGVGPDPSTTSTLWIGLIDVVSQSAVNRGVLQAGGAAVGTGMELFLTATTHFPQVECVAVATSGASDPLAGGVRPFVLKFNRTGSEAKCFTDQEKVTTTFAAGVTDGFKGFGGTINAGIPPNMNIVYGCMWSGANAEMTDAQIKTMLQAMGFTIPWT